MVATYLHTVRQFRRSVRLYLLAVALIGFTYDGGIYAVIFNLYLLRLGFGPDFVGQVNSAGMVAFALTAFPAGALGDRWGNRRLMLLGMVTMFAGSLLLAFGGVAPLGGRRIELLSAYVLLNIGVAFFFVNSVPYLISITTVAERAPAFSVQSAFLSLAAFAGSLLAGFLPGYFALFLSSSLDQPEPYRYPLWLATLLLIGGIWALASTRAEPEQTSHAQDSSIDELGQSRLGLWRLIGLLTVVRLFFVVGSAVAMTFFNVYMDAGLNIPTAQIGLAVAVSRLAAVPAALITPLLAARWGNASLALWSSVGVALFLAPLALAGSWQTAALAYVGVIAMTSIRYPAFLVYSMSMIPVRYRSVVAGAGEMAAGLSFAFIALAGGYIIVTQGYRTLFFTGAALNLLGTLIFGLFIATRRKLEDSQKNTRLS